MYDSADVLAVAVMDGANATLSGISGTAATNVPVAGSATYAGGFSLTYFRGGTMNTPWNARGNFSTTVDFAESTVVGSGSGNYSSSLSITGTLDGTQISGLAQFSATEYTGAAAAVMTGGLYGTNTIAGVYESATATGIFHGVSP